MLALKENSRLVRWAYFHRKKRHCVYDTPDNAYGRYTNIPASTTLCRFFWRAFVFVPLMWLGLLTTIGLLLRFVYKQLVEIGVQTFLIILSGLLAGAFVIALLRAAYLTNWSQMKRYTLKENTRRTAARIANSTFVQGAKSIKSRFCPTIQFTHE